MVDTFGKGPYIAATLLVAAGNNPERLRSESAFAALYRIVIVRLSHDDRTKEYMRHRISEGMTKPEVIRCLKRYVAHQIYTILREMGHKNLVVASS